MPQSPEHPERGLSTLSPADTDLLDRLLAGETIEPEPAQARRLASLRRLLGLLDLWDAQDPAPALAGQTLARIVGSATVSLSAEDREVLDAALALRQRGLETGPMPADSRDRLKKLTQLLALLDGRTADEPVPKGLVGRTIKAIEQDRAEQRRLTLPAASAPYAGSAVPSAGTLRQIATTAALVLMCLSVMLPILSKGRSDAMVAQCGQNLAGLGADLQRYAEDNDQQTDIFGQHFASTQADGSIVPASEANVFVLVEQAHADPSKLECPSAPDRATAYYNGQNPAAGGPVRVFLDPRPIFADTNPLYRVTPNGLVRDDSAEALSISNNHGGAGQNVLIGDGSVRWMIRPTVRQGQAASDNIWLMDESSDSPADSPDVFLTP